MKTTMTLLAALGLAASASVATAKPVSFNYAQVQFVNQDLDDYNCNQDGLRLKGSFELNDDFFVPISFSDVSGNRGCGSNAIDVGIGYHTLFGADSRVYGTLSYEHISPDHGDSDSGLAAAIGLRGFVQHNLEARVEVSHHVAGNGNTVLGGGIAFYVMPTLAATADVGLGTEASEIAVGLRLDF